MLRIIPPLCRCDTIAETGKHEHGGPGDTSPMPPVGRHEHRTSIIFPVPSLETPRPDSPFDGAILPANGGAA
jgi:hypothetical protein